MILLIVIACLVIALGLCLLRVREYRRWFRLPTRRTDALQCRLAAAVVPVHLERDGFEVPVDVPLLGRTVLLELRVRVLPLLGTLFDPSIEIARGGRTYRQYFERGARGERLLDLSPLFQGTQAAVDARVRLHGRLMRWQREAALRVFEAPALADSNVLIVAPHPDDAEIAAFGMYATHNSWVVTITAGERGGGLPRVDIPSGECWQWAALLRVADSLSVPQLGKVRPERCLNLAYPGAALERMHRQPSHCFQLACEPRLPRSELRSMNPLPQFRPDPACTWNSLIEDLRQVLELAKPDIIICPHPFLDTHSDHVFAAHAVEGALRKSPGPRPLLLLYAVHRAGAPVYPLGPANAIAGIAPHSCQRWVADSIYSHALSPQVRLAKFFALESMHAVRANRLPLAEQVRGWLAGLGTDPTSFLRRAPRPTEIYYVLAGERLSEMVAAG